MTGRLTLPRTARLAARGDIDRVFRSGKFVHGRNLVIGFRPSGLAHTRCAIIIPRAKCALSSARNRTRRLVRELFRLARPTLPAGYDLVVLPRRARARDDYPAWAADWSALLRKAGLSRTDAA